MTATKKEGAQGMSLEERVTQLEREVRSLRKDLATHWHQTEVVPSGPVTKFEEKLGKISGTCQVLLPNAKETDLKGAT